MPFDMGLRGKDLFDHIRKQIVAEPETWNQKSWGRRLVDYRKEAGISVLTPDIVEPCGAAYCLAGWAVLLCGDPVVFYPGVPTSDMTLSGAQVRLRAGEFLGISWYPQASRLFDGFNALSDIDRIAAEIWPEKEVSK